MSFCRIIIQGHGNPDQQADVTFDDRELAVLRNYFREYNRLSNSRPLQQRLPCEMTLKFTKEAGVSVNGEWPSDDDFAILLHRMRPFLLQNERSSYVKTVAILGKRMPHPVFREYMKEQSEYWHGGSFKNEFHIIDNSKKLDPEKLFIDWLNSYEFHRDEGRTNNFQGLRQYFPVLLQTIITTRTLEKLRAVRNTAFLLGLLLGEIKELKFEPYMLLRE